MDGSTQTGDAHPVERTTGLNAEERHLRASLAANTRWMRPGERQRQSDGQRSRLRERFADRIDPARKLPADELEQLVDSAIAAHMARMRFARARKREAELEAPEAVAT
jgi:hypothetical protein